MNKLLVIFMLICLTGCKESGCQLVRDSWFKHKKRFSSNSGYMCFRDINHVQSNLHKKKVQIQGKLVYEYDETAIFPVDTYNDFKPVWIYLEGDDTELHSFLLKYDGANINLTGILDTTRYLYDNYYYRCAVKDIVSVEVQ